MGCPVFVQLATAPTRPQIHRVGGSQIRTVAPGVHVVEARQRFYGIEVGARMTVLALEGGLLVHSPVAVDPDLLAPLGEPRWVLAPNLLHHLHVGPWLQAGLEGWAAPGLPEKRRDLRFDGVVGAGELPFGEEVEVLPLRSFPFTHEVVLWHRPSRTLIVSDLVFNFSRAAPWSTRFAMSCLGGYPGCRTTVLERVGMRRAAARRELGVLAGWDFDRVVMAHGEILETGGKRALLSAFGWLGAPVTGLLSG